MCVCVVLLFVFKKRLSNDAPRHLKDCHEQRAVPTEESFDAASPNKLTASLAQISEKISIYK